MTVAKRIELLQTGSYGFVKRMTSWLDKRSACGYSQDSHEWSSKQQVLRGLKSCSPR
jgi:hypothetical protein